MIGEDRPQTSLVLREKTVYLLLGSPHDLCCLSVQAALQARGLSTHFISNPLESPFRFAWRLTNEESSSQLACDEQATVFDDTISGVLVRRTGWVDPTGWQTDDLGYMQSETYAALLGWLWSLPCTVVNRYPAAIWYQTQVHHLSWQRLLRRCGLPTPETLVTNIDDESRAFGQQLSNEGVAGVVYGPLTRDTRYLITDDKDWAGLAAMQRRGPVCLTYPHEAVQFVCLVGQETIWEGEPPAEAVELEPALHSFAAALGLTFIELALSRTSQGICVIAVETHPDFQHFGFRAQQQIVDGLVQLLTADAGRNCNSAVQTVERSCL